jgi:phage terminase large subunit
MPYVVEEGCPDRGFRPRGAPLALWKCKDHEVMLAGPAETGKTFGCLQKLDALLWKYPRAQALIARKTLKSLHASAVQTYVRKVLGAGSPVRPFGGARPAWFDYPNGSRLTLAGLDDPGKVLSSEYDFAFVNQAEELDVEDWETLLSRTTGRAGNAPYAQLIGDCNPGPPTHWILHRPSLLLLESRHEDNPTLFDDQGIRTEQGQRTLAVLDALTGVRKQRLRFGRWVQAEGAIYPEWDRAIHLIDAREIPFDWPRYWSVDFGYTHAFVCLFGAVDPDGRLYVYREVHHTKRLVEDHTRTLLGLLADDQEEARRQARIRWELERSRYPEERREKELARRLKDAAAAVVPQAVISDHDAEDRATLERHLDRGVTPAWKEVSPGIQAVASRLRRAGDGKPRLFVVRDGLHERDAELAEQRKPTCLAEEMECYSWREDVGVRPREEPHKVDDDAVDALRYLVAHLDPHGIPPSVFVIDGNGPPPGMADDEDQPRRPYTDETPSERQRRSGFLGGRFDETLNDEALWRPW